MMRTMSCCPCGSMLPAGAGVWCAVCQVRGRELPEGGEGDL